MKRARNLEKIDFRHARRGVCFHLLRAQSASQPAGKSSCRNSISRYHDVFFIARRGFISVVYRRGVTSSDHLIFFEVIGILRADARASAHLKDVASQRNYLVLTKCSRVLEAGKASRGTSGEPWRLLRLHLRGDAVAAAGAQSSRKPSSPRVLHPSFIHFLPQR